MGDLVWGVLLLGAIYCLVYLGSFRVARWGSPWLATILAVTASLFMLVFSLTVHGKLVIAQWLPLSNAIILGNWLPLGAGVLCGVLSGQRSIPRWRRATLSLVLTVGGWWSVLVNFLPGPQVSDELWTPEGVCLQSSAASCSPAAAATLLRFHGIEASEAEMMRLCLTRHGGSPSLGLYRGLVLKTRGTAWRVEVVRGTAEELCSDLSTPVLLRMRLPRDPGLMSRFAGWTGQVPDQGHAAVLFAVTEDGRRLRVGDPSAGIHHWLAEDFLARWRGEGLRLVARSNGGRNEERGWGAGLVQNQGLYRASSAGAGQGLDRAIPGW
jgi:hypothetical protein